VLFAFLLRGFRVCPVVSGATHYNADMQLPDLRVLPLNALVPHERTDPRRVNPLTERLQHEDVLRNPPIVAPFDGRRFVVLDGANRTTAFQTLGVPHILAQVVPYEKVHLHVWHHAITQCSMLDLLDQVRGIAGLRLSEGDLMSARAALARREALAFIALDDGSPIPDDTTLEHPPSAILLSGGNTLVQRTELLNQLVDVYEGCSKIQRTAGDSLVEARHAFPDASAVVVFPRYEPAEIIDLARTGVRLPAGITRHVLPLRALRLNYPMDVLRADLPLSQKQAHLSEWVHERVLSRSVRTYVEPTVMFDE
jgi:hypothetical protein